MTANKVKVKISDRRSVVVGGRVVEAGETVEVPPADAKTLISEGYAEKA